MRYGLEPVIPDATGQEAVMSAVRHVKAGGESGPARAWISLAMDALAAAGADIAVAAGTEIPCSSRRRTMARFPSWTPLTAWLVRSSSALIREPRSRRARVPVLGRGLAAATASCGERPVCTQGGLSWETL